jgi:multidrug efflux system outer membrane protein
MLVRNLTLTLLAASALSACTLAPKTVRPELPVANAWPIAGANTNSTASAADLGWRDVFIDPRLQGVIDLALANNRDLRVATLNIEQSRAQYRIQRAALVPAVDATGTGTQAQSSSAQVISGGDRTVRVYTAGVGVTSWEIDLFGRIRSLKDAALQNYLATREIGRSVQISLVAQTASAWLNLAADQDLLALAEETLRTRQQTTNLTRSRFEAGAISQLELSQALTLVEAARSDVATAVALVVPTCWPPSTNWPAPTPISARPARPSSRPSA